jgi:drug/metabolite transporter (DMT)-like permease
MKNFSPAIVATHAFINPIVAILLGTVFAHEIITIRMLIAASIIVLSVLFITQKSQT